MKYPYTLYKSADDSRVVTDEKSEKDARDEGYKEHAKVVKADAKAEAADAKKG